MKVLLVEDEKKVSSIIKRGLEENGMQVTQAFDGLSGLRMAQRNNFDVVILDIIMPEMNGLQVCSRLREQFGSDISILMLTASSTTDDIVDGLNTGADDYLVKPFKLRELEARVLALGRRKFSVARTLKVRDLEMNREAKEVNRAGQIITLTARV